MAPRASTNIVNRTKRTIGMTIIAGAAAVTVAGMALAPGIARAFTYESDAAYRDQIVQSFTLNLASELEFEYSTVAQAYHRVTDPANNPDELNKDGLIEGLATELSVAEPDMETAFEAAWHQTLMDMDRLNLDQFENWMGQLTTDGEITDAQSSEAIEWFKDGPDNLSPATLLAAMNADRDEALADGVSLYEMEFIEIGELQELEEWYDERPDFLPTHQVLIEQQPADPGNPPAG